MATQKHFEPKYPHNPANNIRQKALNMYTDKQTLKQLHAKIRHDNSHIRIARYQKCIMIRLLEREGRSLRGITSNTKGELNGI